MNLRCPLSTVSYSPSPIVPLSSASLTWWFTMEQCLIVSNFFPESSLFGFPSHCHKTIGQTLDKIPNFQLLHQTFDSSNQVIGLSHRKCLLFIHLDQIRLFNYLELSLIKCLMGLFLMEVKILISVEDTLYWNGQGEKEVWAFPLLCWFSNSQQPNTVFQLIPGNIVYRLFLQLELLTLQLRNTHNPSSSNPGHVDFPYF